MAVAADLLLIHVGEQEILRLDILLRHAGIDVGEIVGEGADIVVMVLGPARQMLARQRAGRPGLGEGRGIGALAADRGLQRAAQLVGIQDAIQLGGLDHDTSLLSWGRPQPGDSKTGSRRTHSDRLAPGIWNRLTPETTEPALPETTGPSEAANSANPGTAERRRPAGAGVCAGCSAQPPYRDTVCKIAARARPFSRQSNPKPAHPASTTDNPKPRNPPPNNLGNQRPSPARIPPQRSVCGFVRRQPPN